METAKMIKSLGVEKNEAEDLADIIDSANQSELLYMAIFLAGIKIGQMIERTKNLRKKKKVE